MAEGNNSTSGIDMSEYRVSSVSIDKTNLSEDDFINIKTVLLQKEEADHMGEDNITAISICKETVEPEKTSYISSLLVNGEETGRNTAMFL